MDPTRQQKILDLMEAKLAERGGDFAGAKGIGNRSGWWEGVGGRGDQEIAKIAKIDTCQDCLRIIKKLERSGYSSVRKLFGTYCASLCQVAYHTGSS